MKSVWIYAPAPRWEIWFDALAPSLEEAGIEHHKLPSEAGQGGVHGRKQSLTETIRRASGMLCVGETNDPRLSDINRACRAASLPLLLVSPFDASLQIGPGVVFGTSPCLACFENHNKFLPLDKASASTRTETANSSAPLPPPDGQMLREIIDFLGGAPASLLRRGYVFRAGSKEGGIRRFRVLKNPTCMVCSVYAEHPTESTRINT